MHCRTQLQESAHPIPSKVEAIIRFSKAVSSLAATTPTVPIVFSTRLLRQESALHHQAAGTRWPSSSQPQQEPCRVLVEVLRCLARPLYSNGFTPPTATQTLPSLCFFPTTPSLKQRLASKTPKVDLILWLLLPTTPSTSACPAQHSRTYHAAVTALRL